MSLLTNHLDLKQFIQITYGNEKLDIDDDIWEKVDASHNFLQKFAENKVIYGVNTGFGPMAQYRIKDEDRTKLQYNLIRSHASGTGRLLDPLQVKSTILARLNTLTLGYSGVHKSTIALMRELINRDIYPVIFAHGGVGASGDLVQLAHLALVLIGEGEVMYKNERIPTKQAFDAEGLAPIEIVLREGLALINGTSVMTGIGILNWNHAQKALSWSIKAACAINEIVQAYDDHFSEALNQSKKHPGQQAIAKKMRSHLASSKLIRKREEHLYTGENQEDIFKDKVQEYYSVRCVPQILGPVSDTINNVGTVLEHELNSANDNPIIDLNDQHVYHGGNFHGDYISLEMDKLKLVMTKMTMLAERQLNYLLNSKINEIFPPFVNLGTLGLNFGMQGVQFTATSTTAESQALSTSLYIHSIPNNNDNQDIVSMGTNAAMSCSQVIENSFEVLAIEFITLAQAIDHLSCQEKLAKETLSWYTDLRNLFPAFAEDQVMYPIIKKVKEYLINKNHD